jgi:hypothetical protein
MDAAVMAMSSVRIPMVADRAAHPGQRGRASPCSRVSLRLPARYSTAAPNGRLQRGRKGR